MTLEKIQGMNLQVGTPIEIKLEDYQMGGGYYGVIGYFKKISNEKDVTLASLIYNPTTKFDNSESELIRINEIESITILTPQK
jgi:hypothetical protein